jgi:GMP synthase-like glutamine amidotransferase
MLSGAGKTPRILVMDHRGQSVSELVEYLRPRASFDRIHPEEVRAFGPALASGYDGILATGGFLESGSRRRVLDWYGDLLRESEKPFLGICLGMKIVGYCYGARMRKTPPDVGFREISFQGDFPLAEGVKTLRVYEKHKFELVPPLPRPLRNYASGGSPVQAVTVDGRPQFAVQFHPEVGSDATIVLDRFLELCAGRARKTLSSSPPRPGA